MEAKRKKVLVYLDEGVDAFSFRHCIARLRLSLPSHQVKRIDRRQFLAHGWEKETASLVFPGGRDIPYDRALRGEANSRIRTFIQEGGSYFGICAGAYYGASEVEFEKGGKLEVCEKRELAFFSKKAIGPAYGKNLFSYKTQRGARMAKVKWKGGIASVHFNGGCFFEPSNCSQVLGNYEDFKPQPAAIVCCKVGDGKALLCGVHPEHPHSDQLFWDYLLSKLI
ncbi:MAG: hypothetical protein S4CHLAM45_14650 [Chlamydiales bacterium]|nr:hypothetical protein [Chlamydiales bacterium]MCH9620573.1 hypothetical protein [Chlamydiales bacterium]MCH9623555.1 hypothetical protein [Chlamydiales bacterium]